MESYMAFTTLIKITEDDKDEDEVEVEVEIEIEKANIPWNDLKSFGWALSVLNEIALNLSCPSV